MSKKKKSLSNKLGNTKGYVDINTDNVGENLALAKQEFQNFIKQSGSMMQSWGASIAGFGENLTLWTPPVKVGVSQELSPQLSKWLEPPSPAEKMRRMFKLIDESEQRLKNEDFDASTARLVDEWFREYHSEVIAAFEASPNLGEFYIVINPDETVSITHAEDLPQTEKTKRYKKGKWKKK
jgi:hypothetical protein